MSHRARPGEQRSWETAGFGTCSCGKIRLLTRKAAKAAIKRMKGQGRRGGTHLDAYRCVLEPDWWHVGHQPGIITRGEVARADFDPSKRVRNGKQRRAG